MLCPIIDRAAAIINDPIAGGHISLLNQRWQINGVRTVLNYKK